MLRSHTPSLRDIADELNISVSLVSKVLSGRMGSTGVSVETRERIQTKARERNFVPNRAASALRARRAGAVGVFLHPWGEVGTEIVSGFLDGFSGGLRAGSSHLWLTFYGDDEEFTREMTLQDLRRQADAIVVAGVPHPKLHIRLRELEDAGMPVITIFEGNEDRNLTNVAVNCFLQGKLPTDHLIAAGCRKIVHLSRMPARQEGFVAALREAGRTVAPEDLIPVQDYKLETGRIAAQALLASGRSFDGVVAQSDHAALGVLLELQRVGIRVPEQVRITGVDDSVLAKSSSTPLSSVTSEVQTVGRLAAEMILKRLAGEKIDSVRVAPRVIARDSSG